MKVIFLDIDGLLNTYYTKEEVAGYTFVEDGHKLFRSTNGVWHAEAVAPQYFTVDYVTKE